jgi:protocatechuate 3,4-dioxygenase beta subunit
VTILSKIFYILIANLFLISSSIANDFSNLFNSRTPTPERLFLNSYSMPQTFNTTNNLVKKTGSFYLAFGEIIHLKGKITDSFGVPIVGAVVKIWQTNSKGKYHTLLAKNDRNIDKNFNMSGTAVTDNLGNYNFITIIPGFYFGRAPHINMNVYHKRFGELKTEIYFEGHPRNKIDSQYLSYTPEDRKSLTAMVRLSDMFNPTSRKICTFNIVLRGTHQYKDYI